MTAELKRSERIAGIGVSQILARSAAATRLKRSGRPVIILGAGEPDFDTPDHVKAAACRAIAEGQTKYTALDGTLELKSAIQAKLARENSLRYEIQEITCAAGAKQVLFNAFMATLDPGDEVIIPAPFWTSYADIVKVAGGVPVVIPCEAAALFRLSADQLAAAITPRTRWLLINSPSNPSGATYDRSSLEALASVVRSHPQVWVMSDDIYEHILYDDRPFVTFAQAAPDLRDRALIVNGVSKAYAMTGWRIGFGAGPAPLISAMAIIQSQSTSCPSSVSQAAAIAALDGPQAVVVERCRDFQRRRDFVVSRLNTVEGLSCRPPEGAFYAFVRCAGLIGARTSGGHALESDEDVADYLLENDVAVIPGSCFGLAPYFRISYATGMDELALALDRIDHACRRLQGRTTSCTL